MKDYLIDQKQLMIVVLDALPLLLYVDAAVQLPLQLIDNTVVVVADDDTLLLGLLIHVMMVAATLYPDTTG